MPRLSNDKHERFARIVAHTMDREHAADAVGLTYSTAHTVCSRVEVRERIRELSESMLTAAGITAERVMLELGRLAFRDTRKAYAADGSLLPIHELDDDTAAALNGVEHEVRVTKGAKRMELDLVTGEMVEVTPRVEVRTTKVKFAAKDVSLTTLAKRFKLIGDEGDGVNALANALADRLKTARKRVKGTSDET